MILAATYINFPKDDMMYYANRVDSDENEHSIEIVNYITGSELPEKPSKLFCKPQSEARVADILKGMTDDMSVEDSVEDLLSKLAEKLEPLVEMLWDEHCNVYLIESNVS